ncbi:MAG: hypothetical protein ACK4F9_02055 [Brevinematia bacterium]
MRNTKVKHIRGTKIVFRKIVMSIKLFIALQVSKQLNVAYVTVMKIYDMLRKAIY